MVTLVLLHSSLRSACVRHGELGTLEEWRDPYIYMSGEYREV